MPASRLEQAFTRCPTNRQPAPIATAVITQHAPAIRQSLPVTAADPMSPNSGGFRQPSTAEGCLIVTPGNETDFDVIETDVRELCSRFRVVSVGYDPWQSTQMSQRLRAEGVPMFEFRATTQNFSPAIVEIDAAMRAGRLRHDGNPVLEWCLGNVVGKADRRGNLYPTKQRPDQKIDAAVALMMAVGRAMTVDEDQAGLDGFLANPLIF